MPLSRSLVLCALVDLCQKQLRQVDILGRYGGEEFVMLMPETMVQDAMQVAERLRLKIARMKTGTPVGKLSLTVSIGVTGFDMERAQPPTMEDLIKFADDAMYAAKAAGRNCIRVSGNIS